MASGLTAGPSKEKARVMDEKQILSEHSLRYRRNTLAICFVTTVLLVVPGIDLKNLSIFGVSADSINTNPAIWIWGIVVVLLAFNIIMFLIYAVTEAHSWIFSKKTSNLHPLWYEATKVFPLKFFYKPIHGAVTIKKMNHDDLEYTIYELDDKAIAVRMPIRIENIVNTKIAVRRMVWVEFGIPLVWTLGLAVFAVKMQLT